MCRKRAIDDDLWPTVCTSVKLGYNNFFHQLLAGQAHSFIRPLTTSNRFSEPKPEPVPGL